ncbi:MAG: acyl carrier protein [Lachnospiraceae bacterium]|nr:acyl carrier protein [Lachnospiraceae bacterium]
MDRTLEFKELIAQYCDVAAEDLTEDMRFREDLDFSSLGFMSFLGDIEDTFDVELDQEQALKVITVGDALDMFNDLVEA